ncbi:hypothetical protein M8494_05345 [Serratia ureilytica]
MAAVDPQPAAERAVQPAGAAHQPQIPPARQQGGWRSTSARCWCAR